MKHVAIHAYPFGNVGDDLFIVTLCERYPHVQFHLALQRKYAKAFRHVPNLTLHSTDRLRSKLRTWMQKDTLFPRMTWQKICATVVIGGSLFMEQNGWEQAFDRMKLMQQTEKPFFIVGANFGPYQSQTFIDTYEAFFRSTSAVSFRDLYSYTLFSHLDNVRYAPDVIFNRAQTISKEMQAGEKRLLISVIYPSIRTHLAREDERYFSHIAHIVEQAVNEQYTVILSAFCPYEQDDVAIKEIVQRLSVDVRKQVRVHVYDGDMKDVYWQFQQATIVIATRFHAMILGWLLNKKVFPIIYSEKMERVLEDLDFEGDYERVEQIDDDVYTRMQQQPRTKIDMRQLAKQSEVHFHALDEFLHRE